MAVTKKSPVRRKAVNAVAPEPQMRRWTEQRWVIDNTIRSVGVEWDQPRLGNYATACGPQSAGDIAAIRSRAHAMR